MADDEVEMQEAASLDANENEKAVDLAQPVQSIETDPREEEEGEEDADQNAGSDGDEVDTSGRPVSTQLYKALKQITDVLTNYKIKVKHRRIEEDHFPSILFRRLPNKRNLPDYYEVIKDPSALSTLKGKIQRKQYTGIPEFVRDFALIVHNAQIYNRPNSAPVRDVLRLESIFKDEMQKLVDAGLVEQEQTKFPDLGEIPYATPEPDPAEEEDDDIDDDEDDEDDDSDDDQRKKRGRRGRLSIGGKNKDREDDEDNDNDNEKANDAEQKRRGRPPKVDTPMEARIKSVLKGLRKYKNSKGQIVIFDFEKLPDKAEHPAYYVAIQNPMALDMIKKKAKRKKYNFIEEFMQDLELMFNNAMVYNEDSSPIHDSAKELLEEAKKLVQIEKDKPDSEYLMQDGRLPLPFIEYNGKMWRIGDWIHIQNPNDVTKPIVAQIYRTWQDPDERKWINACWYYRPEQTVHQYEKHFYPKEVVKTGQYRDHPIEEVIDKCFVMFFTRYGKGRPRGIDPSTEVYVCDSRYNEEKYKFNKIKTWASCLPDEVRDKDYEMDLYDVPKRIKKVPSPLINTLKEDAKEDDEIPQPTWAHPNAPPVTGAVHRRPRDENQSPPPEPTPPPPPTPPPVVRVPSAQLQPQQSRPSFDRQASGPNGVSGAMSRPSPSMTPQTPGFPGATPTAQHNRQAYPQNSVQAMNTPMQIQTPINHQPAAYAVTQQAYATPNLGAAHPNSYAGANPVQPYSRPPMPTYQQQPYPQAYPPNSDQSIRGKEVFTLPDNANDLIPKEIRDLYPQDENGRVLFFSQPPIDSRHIVEGKTDAEKGRPLEHTEKLMRVRKYRENILAKRKREETSGGSLNDSQIPNKKQQLNGDITNHDQEVLPRDKEVDVSEQSKDKQASSSPADAIVKAVENFNQRMYKNNFDYYKINYGEGWQRIMLEDLKKDDELRIATEKDKVHENARAESSTEQENMTPYEKAQQKIKDRRETGFGQCFWTGKYLDDVDPRLPPFN